MIRLLLYQRYLIRETALAVLLVLSALLVLYSFFDLLAEVRHLGRGNYQWPQAVAFVALLIPGRAYELMPIAVLIGSLYALTTLARHSEITVMRTSGLSTADLLTTLLKIAAFFALLTLLCGEFLAPASERAAQNLYLSSTKKLIGEGLRTGVWIKDGSNFINIKSATTEAVISDVRIYNFDDQHQLASVSEAKQGNYLGNGTWQLKQVKRTTLTDLLAEVEYKPQVMWSGALTPDILNVLVVPPERMTLYQLVTYTQHLADNKQKTGRYRIAMWKKLFYPLSLLVMIALALPFAYTHSRTGSVSLKIFFGVMTGIFFYMLNGLFSSLGAIHYWPPMLSALMPPLLFFLLAIGALWWVSRR